MSVAVLGDHGRHERHQLVCLSKNCNIITVAKLYWMVGNVVAPPGRVIGPWWTSRKAQSSLDALRFKRREWKGVCEIREAVTLCKTNAHNIER